MTLLASRLALFAVLCFFEELPQAKEELREGLYMTCDEVFGYFQETIELEQGHFRYWMNSDSGDPTNVPDYPLSGTYKITDNKVLFETKDIKERTFSVFNGVPVLWREDALELWNDKKRIHRYGILIRVGDVPKVPLFPEPPSIYLVYTEEMRSQEKKDFEERFNDLQNPARDLLRAYTMEEDLEEYTERIRKIRASVDPMILRQLVGLMARKSGISTEAGIILTKIFLPDRIHTPEEPPFKGRPKDLKAALTLLIDALSAAEDRRALESTLIIFLRASATEKIDLIIAGVHVRVEARPDGSNVFGSKSLQLGDPSWKDVMPAVTGACQEWMRKQVYLLPER